MHSIRDHLQYAIDQFGAFSTPRLDAELLLCHVLNVSRSSLISHSSNILNETQKKQFLYLTERRATGEPIAYIVGHKEFFGRKFEVSPAVLIPRPETELLVEKSLDFIRSSKLETNLLDLGTGSGCVAVSIAAELKKEGRPFEISATDISSDALSIAMKNAASHGVIDSIKFLETSWFKGFSSQKKFSCIVSNPPYIAEGDPNVGSEISFEPSGALYSGTSGLDAIIEIVSLLPSRLVVGGRAFIEFGYGQDEAVKSLVKSIPNLVVLEVVSDLAGIPRVISIQHSSL